MIYRTIENLNSRNNQINSHSCWWHYYEKKESSKSHRIVDLWKKVIFYCFYHKSICLSSKRHCTGNCSLFFNGNTITKRGSASTIWSFFSYAASTIWSFFSYGFGKNSKISCSHCTQSLIRLSFSILIWLLIIFYNFRRF